mgnify:FL=1
MTKHYSVLGIGLGPFNLSAAALLAPHSQSISSLFVEQKPRFAWHPGLLLDDAKMQTSYLKDMVTAVDPTSPYTFINYLVKTKKFYPFTARGEQTVSRLEFSDYMAWVAHQLPNTQFDTPVLNITPRDSGFAVNTPHGQLTCDHLIVGTGTQPFMPDCATPFVGEAVFHASELALRQPDLRDKKVAIVGGGQTGADVFQHVFDGEFGKVAHIDWISRRPNLQGLDENPFTDQYFMPDYAAQFHGLEPNVKHTQLAQQKLASDGITEDCLKGLYQRLYHDKYVRRSPSWWRLLPGQTLTGMQSHQAGYHLATTATLTSETTTLDAEVVIVCTGFSRALPQCLDTLRGHLALDDKGRPNVNAHYRVEMREGCSQALYMVNVGTHCHGIIEPQLSLAAWRAATIINAISGTPIYDIAHHHGLLDWTLTESAASTPKMQKVAGW